MKDCSQRVVLTAILVVGFASLIAAAEAAGRGDRSLPNIVLMLVDDMGWTGAGCYGSDLHETPHIDGLARDGVRFTDAYAAAPVCTPTRASILTGRSPAQLHITVWREATGEPPAWMRQKLIPPVTERNLPQSSATLGEVLRAAGYLTAHIGKWHLGDAANYPENHGFDVNIGGTHWGCPATFFAPYRGLFGSQRERRYVPGVPFGKPGEYLTDRLTDAAVQIIDRAGTRPFFLNLWYYTVHTPIEGKPELAAYYEKKIKKGMDHDNAHYAAMHHTLDENVGRILAKLRERGIAKNTVVIFTSDNGGYVNDYRGRRVTSNAPLRSGKGSLYEGGIRVPLIVRWPGVTPKGRVCREPVITTDLYSTICELIGTVPRRGGIEGLSLVPLLAHPAATLQRESLCFHYPHYYPTTSPVSAIRAGDWKLLEYYEDRHVELYNLADDLGEATNLANTMPEKAAEVRGKLHAWLNIVEAQKPRPNPDRSP